MKKKRVDFLVSIIYTNLFESESEFQIMLVTVEILVYYTMDSRANYVREVDMKYTSLQNLFRKT